MAWQSRPLGAAAARGVGILVGRTLLLQVLTAGVTVVVARILTPEDYGLFAIALSVQLAGQYIAELGLPAALIRMSSEPSRALQGTVTAVMTLVGLAICAILWSLSLLIWHDSKVMEAIAITSIAMPLYAMRAVPMALLDRDLSFGRVAAVETAETIAFNAFALAGTLLGMGAFSLLGGVPAGALVGMALAWWIRPSSTDFSLSLRTIRPLAAFGGQVGAMGMFHLGKDLGFVSLIGGLSSTVMAGYFGMAKRLFSFPIALSGAVARVSLPTFSKDRATGAAKTGNMMGQLSLVCGFSLVAVLACLDPIISIVLSDKWLPITDIVIYGSLAMFISACISSPINGFLLSRGSATPPLIAVVAEVVVSFGLLAALVGSLEQTAIGLAMSAGAVASSVVLYVAAPGEIRRSIGVALKAVAVTAAAALLGATVAGGDSLSQLALGAATSIGCWLALTWLLMTNEFMTLIRSLNHLRFWTRPQ